MATTKAKDATTKPTRKPRAKAVPTVPTVAKAKPATKKTQRASKPAIDPAAREKQLINLAVDLAESQLLDGTAPPSVINHFLKLGSSANELEMKKLEAQTVLATAKSKGIEANASTESSAAEAVSALSSYRPSEK